MPLPIPESSPIPAGLSPIQARVWRAALALQAGDPARAVAVPELARAADLSPTRVHATIRVLRRRAAVDPDAPAWPFPLRRDDHRPLVRRSPAGREAATDPPSPPRAFRVEWRDHVWAIAATSQNAAKGEAMRQLWERFPGERIRYYPDVRVGRWELYDAWALEDRTGRLRTRDEVEDWMEAHAVNRGEEVAGGR